MNLSTTYLVVCETVFQLSTIHYSLSTLNYFPNPTPHYQLVESK
jgi:hypothetical protein